MTSLQFILPEGTKHFLTGGNIRDGFFPIKGAGGPLYVCERYTTGETGTDFNDLKTACGLDAVKERLTVEPKPSGDLFTDLENASRFAEKHRAKIRFCHKFNRWLVWNGKRWEDA